MTICSSLKKLCCFIPLCLCLGCSLLLKYPFYLSVWQTLTYHFRPSWRVFLWSICWTTQANNSFSWATKVLGTSIILFLTFYYKYLFMSVFLTILWASLRLEPYCISVSLAQCLTYEKCLMNVFWCVELFYLGHKIGKRCGRIWTQIFVNSNPCFIHYLILSSS